MSHTLVANNYEAKLDVYYPPGAKAPVPVVMAIHGGGWIEGTKEEFDSERPPIPSDGLRGRQRGVPPGQESLRRPLPWRTVYAPFTGLEEMHRSTTSISAR